MEPRGDQGHASGAFGEAKVDGREAGKDDDVVGAGALAVEASESGEGAEALGGAGRSAGEPSTPRKSK